MAEPDPDNLKLLRRNVQLNRSNVTIVPVAISSSQGKATLSHSRGGGAFHSIVSSAAADRTFEVSTISLGNLFDECNIEKCDLLKIDCEGAEYEIFDAFEDFGRIRKLATEYRSLAGGDCSDMSALAEGVIRKFSHRRVLQNHSFGPEFPCGHLFMA